MKPYYEDDACMIYHADCREVLPGLVGDIIITDPPYGIGYKPMAGTGTLYANNPADLAPVHDDDEPFDPRHLLDHQDRVVLFGGNHFASRLPDSPTWFVWDKRDGHGGWDAFADCEMIWANTGGPARIFHHYWMGGITASERSKKVHPTQKPVALMRWLLEHTTEPGEIVLDPYMGSGPIARAAKDLGRRYVGIEIEERYCEAAVHRLAQEVLALEMV